MNLKRLAEVLALLATFVVLALVAFYLLVPQRERFIGITPTGTSSESIYRDDANQTPSVIDKKLSLSRDVLNDRNDFLQLRRCYQFPQFTIDDFQRFKGMYDYPPLGEAMYYSEFSMLASNFTQVESRIAEEIQKFQQLLCQNKNISKDDCSDKIKGPVYVMLFQAPYYRDNNGGEIAVQNDVDTLYGSMPTNMLRSNGGSTSNIYFYVQILFSRYSKTLGLMKFDFVRSLIMPAADKQYFSKEKQCFVRLQGNYDKFGGCASSESSTAPAYKASCLGPRTAINPPSTDKKDTLSTFAILYEVNPSYVGVQSFIEDAAINPADMIPGCGAFDENVYRSRYDPNNRIKDVKQQWADTTYEAARMKQPLQNGPFAYIKGKPIPGIWDEEAYLALYNDVKCSNMTGIQHYKTKGVQQGRKICLKSPLSG